VNIENALLELEGRDISELSRDIKRERESEREGLVCGKKGMNGGPGDVSMCERIPLIKVLVLSKVK
jgi:hypothetical protein